MADNIGEAFAALGQRWDAMVAREQPLTVARALGEQYDTVNPTALDTLEQLQERLEALHRDREEQHHYQGMSY